MTPHPHTAIIFGSDATVALEIPPGSGPRVLFSVQGAPESSPTVALKTAEDAVFDHPVLFDSPEPPVIVTDWPRRVVVPPGEAADAADALRMAEAIYPAISGFEPLVTSAGPADVVSLVPRGLTGFMARTFPDSPVADALSLFLADAAHTDAAEGRATLTALYVLPYLDVAAFRGTSLQFCARQFAPDPADAVYMLAATWTNLGFSAADDTLILRGDTADTDPVARRLRTRIRALRTVPDPYAAYRAAILLTQKANTQ